LAALSCTLKASSFSLVLLERNNKDASPHSIWCEILAEVQNFNQNAGTITLDTLPDDLVEYFKPKARER
jgi:hypothetical protein